MKIELKEVSVEELTEGYQDNEELGVRAYSGELDVRPPYQREFVYKADQRDAVIHTITQAYPLNVMYWAVREKGGYEVIDGQQRTISICQFVEGEFAVNVGSTEQRRYFHNLQEDEKQQILDYRLMVYLCAGTDSEKLEWFRTINIAGEELTSQELRNAVYSGSWVSAAKPYFSKNGCPAYMIGSDYMSGSPIRQDYLETAIRWINNGDIDGYMALHQHDEDAAELWQYFQEVVGWVERIFPNYRNEMKGLDWGRLYNSHKNDSLNAGKLEQQIVELFDDDEVDNNKGIYEYLLTGNARTLNLRTFSDKIRAAKYENQKGICPMCKKHYTIDQMEADHILPWHSGGKTTLENCQMLCKLDNRTKSGK